MEAILYFIGIILIIFGIYICFGNIIMGFALIGLGGLNLGLYKLISIVDDIERKIKKTDI